MKWRYLSDAEGFLCTVVSTLSPNLISWVSKILNLPSFASFTIVNNEVLTKLSLYVCVNLPWEPEFTVSAKLSMSSKHNLLEIPPLHDQEVRMDLVHTAANTELGCVLPA